MLNYEITKIWRFQQIRLIDVQILREMCSRDNTERVLNTCTNTAAFLIIKFYFQIYILLLLYYN